MLIELQTKEFSSYIHALLAQPCQKITLNAFNPYINDFFVVSDVTDSTFKGTILHEPQPYVPSNPIHENDIERLLSIESESMEGSAWSRVKKTKEAEVWRRESNDEGYPPITKVT